MIKANFSVAAASVPPSEQASEFRARALESIAGSMVFVDGAPLYWDIDNE